LVLQDRDPDHPDQRDSVHQRLRANSSIMQVKKLLGMLLLFLFAVVIPSCPRLASYLYTVG
jgi:hypothetical protein